MSPAQKNLPALFTGNSDGPCFWFMRQAGRYLPEYREVRQKSKNFLNMCYTPEIATEVTLQPIRRFGMDAAIIFSDILVVPHALGAELDFVKGEGPKLVPLRDRQAIETLHTGKLREFLQPVYEAIRLTRKALPEQTSLIGFAGAPWTLACYLVEGQGSKEYTHPRRMAYQDPALFGQLINLLTEAVTGHLLAQIEAGADTLQLFDSWAGVLPEAQRCRWVDAPAKAIVSAVKARYPDVPVIGFPRGIGTGYAEYAATTQVDGMSLDTGICMQWARDTIPASVVLQGNLDPLLLASDREGLLAEAGRLMKLMQGRRYIMNLGHGVIPETPPEHMAALCDRLRELRGEG